MGKVGGEDIEEVGGKGGSGKEERKWREKGREKGKERDRGG